MRPTFRPPFPLSSPLLAVLGVAGIGACGGSTIAVSDSPATDDAGRDGTAGDASSDGAEGGAVDVVGSFELAFRTVTATPRGSGTPLRQSPASLGTTARIDLRAHGANGSAYEAVVTPRWGEPVPYTVTVTRDAVILNGQGTIRGGSPFTETDRWTSIILARGSDGALTGTATATGDATAVGGNISWAATLDAEAIIGRDATRPEMRADLRSEHGPADALLPWDPIVIELAEPVDPQGEQHSRVSNATQTPLAFVWDHAPRNPESWAGATRFVGTVSDAWEGAAGAWTLRNDGAAVRDPSGLVSPPLDGAFTIRSLRQPVPIVAFKSDVISAATWGAVVMYGGGLVGSKDPRCESGACAALGPIDLGICGSAPRVGIATLLTPGATGHVELRYRLLARSADIPSLRSSPFGVDVAQMGFATLSRAVEASSIVLKPLASPIDAMTHGSDWTSLDVAGPSAGVTMGVAVYLGQPSLSAVTCTGGATPSPLTIEVLVEYVKST